MHQALYEFQVTEDATILLESDWKHSLFCHFILSDRESIVHHSCNVFLVNPIFFPLF